MAVTDIPIIILAAGQSTRMRGRDKLLELVDGVPLLRRQAKMARKTTSGQVLVALPTQPHKRFEALDGLDVTALPVAEATEGMNATLRMAFAVLPPCTQAAMLLLADLPDITESDLRKIAQSVDLETDTLIWRGATQSCNAGHPIVFSAELFSAFEKLTGDSGGREIVARAGGKVQLVPLPDDHARRDLDTPEDWAAWRAARRET